jgi:hypothetical protein
VAASHEFPTFWLSCHVHYACRHTGRCCRAGWPLPVEVGVVPAIDAAVADGRLRTIDGQPFWLIESAEAPPGMAGTLRQAGGGCVFHVAAPAAGRHCAVHATLGHDALPSTCRHFPRVCLVDDRGVRVSLSHACPTAAALLVDHEGPVTIVRGPAAVPGRAVPEGLDAREQLPPRLTGRVLMDLDAATAWEAHVVATLAGAGAAGPVAPVLARLRHEAEALADWRPGGASLVDAVAGLGGAEYDAHGPSEARPAPDVRPAAGSALDPSAAAAAHALVTATCRAPWTWQPLPPDLAGDDARLVAPVWDDWAPVVRRYLASRAFGAWITYQGDAARALVAWLDLAALVLRVECARAAGEAGRTLDRALVLAAVRETDLVLVHDVDPGAIAGGLAPA